MFGFLKRRKPQSWKCNTCGVEHIDVPTCFGFEAPWRGLVPEDEFASRVEMNSDMCVVDEKAFFIRGHVEIPILGSGETLALSVWSSLGESSFTHMCQRWEYPDRGNDPPYFGWLSTNIGIYPTDVHLKLSVQSQPPGMTPLFTVEPTEHRLASDQHHGISVSRWHEIAHFFLHTQ